jgi:hypothetical protein
MAGIANDGTTPQERQALRLRQRRKMIQGVEMHAPPTMGRHGENVYPWLTRGEKGVLLWMGNDWVLCSVIARGGLEELGPVLRAVAANEVTD